MGETAGLPVHRALAATLAEASRPLRAPKSQDRIRSASNSPSAVPAHAVKSATSRTWRSVASSSSTSVTRVTSANMPTSQLVRRHQIGAPAARGLPVRTAVADHRPADQGADAFRNAGGYGMRGAHTTDVTTTANTTDPDHPP
eukprot:3077218-Pyramimonas_sp.AAC.1